MNVSLTPELEALVDQKVASGLYQSASEVVREGLRLLAEKDAIRKERLKALQGDVADGIAQLDRGACLPLTDETAANIKRRGRARLGKRAR